MKMSNHAESLVKLLNEINGKIFIEIGVWKSKTLKRLFYKYNQFNEYWAVDPWKEVSEEHGRTSKVSQEHWDKAYMTCCDCLRYFPQLKILKMTSLKAATLFSKEYFDMVFIDGSHLHSDTVDDIKTWLPLVRKEGIVTGHDYPGREGVSTAVNEIIGEKNIEMYPGGVWVYRKVR